MKDFDLFEVVDETMVGEMDILRHRNPSFPPRHQTDAPSDYADCSIESTDSDLEGQLRWARSTVRPARGHIDIL